MLRFDADVAPETLLLSLQGIETRFGRVRAAPDAARTLDLDMVDSGGVVRDAPDPVLPHPRLHTRLFVLRPLCDLAPNWRHPVTGASVAMLIEQAGPQDVRRL